MRRFFLRDGPARARDAAPALGWNGGCRAHERLRRRRSLRWEPMCGGDDLHDSGPVRRPRCLALSGTLALSMGLALLLAACRSSNPGTQGLAEPTASVTPEPDYADVCAPVGADTTTTCLRITLGAIDAARAAEGLRPMLLPADFARLSVPEQLFVALDRERVDRGLAPFAGLVASLDTDAQRGARAAQLPLDRAPTSPRRPPSGSARSTTGSMRTFSGSTTTGPTAASPTARVARTAAAGPTARSSSGAFLRRRATSSWVRPTTPPATRRRATWAALRWPPPWPSTRRADPSTSTPGSRPSPPCPAAPCDPCARFPPRNRSRASRIPRTTWRPCPTTPRTAPTRDWTTPPRARAPPSPPSTMPTHSRACGPWCSRWDSRALTMPEQLFVAINLERVDRGLPPFVGLTTALDANAQHGRRRRQRPARSRPGLRPGRLRVGRRVVQRARRGVRVDVRRRLRQRQPRLHAPRRGGVLGAPQGHPRRFRLRRRPGDGRGRRRQRRHAQRATRAGPPWRSRSPWPARRCTRTCSPGRRWWRRYRPERSDADRPLSRAGPRASLTRVPWRQRERI